MSNQTLEALRLAKEVLIECVRNHPHVNGTRAEVHAAINAISAANAEPQSYVTPDGHSVSENHDGQGLLPHEGKVIHVIPEMLRELKRLREESAAMNAGVADHFNGAVNMVEAAHGVGDEREAFEREIPKHYPRYMTSDWFSFERRIDDIYEKIAINCMWIGWNARALSLPKPDAVEVRDAALPPKIAALILSEWHHGWNQAIDACHAAIKAQSAAPVAQQEGAQP